MTDPTTTHVDVSSIDIRINDPADGKVVMEVSYYEGTLNYTTCLEMPPKTAEALALGLIATVNNMVAEVVKGVTGR